MRPARKKPKKCARKKIRKKKRTARRKGWFSCNVTTHDMESINQALYAHKSQREGKGSWKVLPKDSCEVYKDRDRRNDDKRKDERRDESSEDSAPDTEPREKQTCRCRARHKRCHSSCSTFSSNSHS